MDQVFQGALVTSAVHTLGFCPVLLLALMAALSSAHIGTRLAHSVSQCKPSLGATHAKALASSSSSSSSSMDKTLALKCGRLPNARVVPRCGVVPVVATSAVIDKVDFKKLQNGSDIRGVAVPGVVGEPVNLTELVGEAIGTAFAQWLSDLKKSSASSLTISIGHDSRISANSLQDALARGIANAGSQVVLYGLASTPAMFNSTVTQDAGLFCPADGAVMITASHLPYNRNGFKFFIDSGGLGKPDISNILSRASQIHSTMSDSKPSLKSSWKRVNFMDHYAQELVEAVRNATNGQEKPLEGFHILVDAGNGAGGFFPAKVLEPLGAVTTGSQFLEPDGMFPNHIPNPENKAAMEAITSAVLKHKADLGIIFDTDVDRSAAVDSSGRELNRNRLIALIAAIILAEHPGTTIVTDSVTSDGLTEFIEKKLGGKHHRFKRGYKNVIDEGIRLNSFEETHLAIETSGHGALKENRWLDDGAYLMVKLLIKLAAGKASGEGQGSSVLTNLIKELDEVEFATELRLKIKESDIGSKTFREYGEEVIRHLEALVTSDPNLKKAEKNYEGVRVSGYRGWFLLRLSLHDPVLPLNMEASTQDGIHKLAAFVLESLSSFEALDVSSLSRFLSKS